MGGECIAWGSEPLKAGLEASPHSKDNFWQISESNWARILAWKVGSKGHLQTNLYGNKYPVKQSFIESEPQKSETEHEITETSLIPCRKVQGT